MISKIGAYFAAVVATIFIAAASFGYVPIPGHAPTPAPSTTPLALDKLGQVILAQNNMQSYWSGGVTQWTVPVKGVVVHKIYAAQAKAEASELEAVDRDVPMSVLLALLSSESVFDPQCQNGNFDGSNPTKDPWGYDDGVAQLKLKYIEVNGKTGPAAFATAADAQAFAFDVTKAIPYFMGIYESHLATADSWIAGGGPSSIDTRLMNRYVLAALIFKQGATGADAIFNAGVWPSELNNFQSLVGYFAQQLEQPSVFANL